MTIKEAVNVSSTFGRTFFDQHMAYISAKDVDGMVDDQYTEEAVLISPFDILDTPPPHIVRGNQALKEFFRKYLDWQGGIKVESLYNFAELDDSITFHAILTSNTGRWVVSDAWHMRDGKIDRHYSFAYKLG
jgi:predicted SnoaL-like aldol condensation-catalyzing enzyme